VLRSDGCQVAPDKLRLPIRAGAVNSREGEAPAEPRSDGGRTAQVIFLPDDNPRKASPSFPGAAKTLYPSF
jgi:hypothetical protein